MAGSDARPFVILTGTRTGSTQFWRTLDAHPQVDAFGEMFLDDVQSDHSYANFCRRTEQSSARAAADPRASIASYLDEVWTSRSDAKAIGFKLMYDDMPAELETILADRRPYFIHLVRNNAVKRRVSQVAAKQRGVYHVDSKTSVPKGPVHVPTDSLLHELRARELRVTQGREFLAGFEHTIEVCYEDMVTDRTALFRRVFAFLEVDVIDPAPPKYRKINPDSLRDILANYDEVAATLRGTEFEKDLAE